MSLILLIASKFGAKSFPRILPKENVLKNWVHPGLSMDLVESSFKENQHSSRRFLRAIIPRVIGSPKCLFTEL